MYNGSSKYLNNNMILCDNQYGFQEKHSSSHALTSFINKVANAIDDKNFFGSDDKLFLEVSFWSYRKLLMQLITPFF